MISYIERVKELESDLYEQEQFIEENQINTENM